MLSELHHIGIGQRAVNTTVILLEKIYIHNTAKTQGINKKKCPRILCCIMYYVPLTAVNMSKKKPDALFMILPTEHHTGSHFKMMVEKNSESDA